MIPIGLLRPLAGILGLLTVLIGAWAYGHHQGDASGRAAVQQAWDRERAVQLAAAVAASEANQSIDRQRAAQAQEIARHAELAQDIVRTAAVRAVAAADGLRNRSAAVAAACDRSASDTAFAPASAAAPSPGVLLADVLRRIDTAAGELAAVADQRGVAGAACVAAYDALVP